MSGCGQFDAASLPTPAPTQTASANVITMDDAIRLGLTGVRDDAPLIDPASTGQTNDAWTVMQDTLRRIQVTMGREDHTQTFTRAQKIRRTFVMTADSQTIMPQIEQVLATPGRDPDIQTLSGFYQRLRDGRAELITMMNMPEGSSVVLDTTPVAAMQAIPALADLELLALSHRPEMTMEMDHPVEGEAFRQQILNTFPGVAKILAQHPDQAGWNIFAERYSDSLSRVFMMPLQMKDDATRAMLTRLRQEALGAAILVQVHMAHDRYQSTYQNMKAAESVMQKITESGQASKTAQLSGLAALAFTRAEWYGAYIDLQHMVGKTDNTPSSQNLMIENAALNTAATRPRIPFAQKISGQQGDGAVTISRSMRETKPLSMSGQAIETLLAAPISEP